MQHLQPNTTMQGGKYRIERVLGQGGFGITYLARNTVFDIDVAIKEFFMKDENDRDGSSVTMPNTTKQELFHGQMEKFKKEAKRMFAIKNEHIIGVQDLFEENGTAYYVMDYVDGENLSDRLKRTGKPMTEQEVREILPQILNALKSVHDAGIWHLDLKPANIMVDKSGKVKLIDFGASKQLNAQKGGATTSTAISYTNGYAPREQMEQNYDKFGPWTDIYALGATLYNLLTNKRPPLPTDIDDDITADKHESLPFPDSVSAGTKSLVLMMLNTNRLQRPQSIDAIIDAEKMRTEEPTPTPKEQPTSETTTTYDDESTVIAGSQSKIHEPNANVGSEFKPHNSILCPKCKGKGIVSKIKMGLFGMTEYEIACPLCNGTGLIDPNSAKLKIDKVVIDYTIPTYSKIRISLLSLGILCCILIIIAPSLFFSQRNDAPLDVSFESSPLFDLYIICFYFLFPIFTSLLYALLSKGIWRQNKDIAVLLALCSFLVFAHSGYRLFRANEIINWVLFYGIDFCGLLCGFYILSRCRGNITKLGKIYLAYFSINALLNVFEVSGIYHDFDLTTYTLYESAVWCFDLLWIYGMWWMLTRNPNEIKE